MPIFYGVAGPSRLLARLNQIAYHSDWDSHDDKPAGVTFAEVAANLGLPPDALFASRKRGQAFPDDPDAGSRAQIDRGAPRGRRVSDGGPTADNYARKQIFRLLGLSDDGTCKR